MFQTIVLVGGKKNTKPHHKPTNQTLKTKGPKAALLYIQNINHEQSKSHACTSETTL